jgi:hypothetical protein
VTADAETASDHALTSAAEFREMLSAPRYRT